MSNLNKIEVNSAVHVASFLFPKTLDSVVVADHADAVDTVADLTMYCPKDFDSPDPITQQCRGLVYRGTTLVSQSLPYTAELLEDSHLNDMEDSDVRHIDLDTTVFYPSLEGTLLRMFAVKETVVDGVTTTS